MSFLKIFPLFALVSLFAEIPQQSLWVGYVNEAVYERAVSHLPFLTEPQISELQRLYPQWTQRFEESGWSGWLLSYEHLTFSLLGFSLYGGVDAGFWNKGKKETLVQLSSYLLLRLYLIPFSPGLDLFIEGSIRAPTLLSPTLRSLHQGRFAFQDIFGLGMILGGSSGLHLSLRYFDVHLQDQGATRSIITIPCILSLGCGF